MSQAASPRKVALVHQALALHETLLQFWPAFHWERTASTTLLFSGQPLMADHVHYPGWLVSVDGEPRTIYRTNYLLRGVPLSAGDHIVVFRFRPLRQRIGTVSSIVSPLVLAAIGTPRVARKTEAP